MDCAVSILALPEPVTSQTVVQDAPLRGCPDLESHRRNEPETNCPTCRNRNDAGAALRLQRLAFESGRPSH